MKKTISILLSLVMIVTSMSVFGDATSSKAMEPALITVKTRVDIHEKFSEFNPHSYEAKRLRKEIKNIEKEINEISCSIENIKIRIKEYIDDKEKMAEFYRTKMKIKEGQKDGDSNLWFKARRD